MYEHFDRLSCWCCSLKNLKELKILYKYYPELWQELKEMDKKSYNQFRADYSVEQLEEKYGNKYDECECIQESGNSIALIKSKGGVLNE